MSDTVRPLRSGYNAAVRNMVFVTPATRTTTETFTIEYG